MTRPNRSRRRSRRRASGVLALVFVLLATLSAAGCGGDSDNSSPSRASSSTTPGEITKATASATLTDELGDTAAKLTDAGCTFGTFKEEQAEHVEEGDDLDSSTFPSTSGRHYGDWAPFGLYTTSVDDGYVVHNLEHGGVVAWLGSEVDDATIDAITDLLDDDEKWVVAPRDDIDGLYSAAWATGLSCSPAALATLGPDGTADVLDAWYDVVESTGSDAEKDVPAYAGSMKEPTPERDISIEAPA